MSRSEQILVAFQAALVAVAGDAMPPATRNETLAQLLEAVDGDAHAALNLVDGTIVTRNVTLGPQRIYELGLIAELEWIVQAVTQPDRDAAFDAGLIAIDDVVRAIEAATEVDGSAWGNLQVAHAEITGIERSNLAIDDTPQLKGASIAVTFEFTSDRPF